MGPENTPPPPYMSGTFVLAPPDRNVTFRNKAIDKVELFNEYFCEQFSDPSLYDTDINWTNDSTLNEIDFAIPRIEKFLSCINSNKACGPDGIHGKILKLQFWFIAN